MKLAFYYPWYGNPEYSNRYIHWENVNLHNTRIGNSPNYPVLGPYDSKAKSVIHTHCKQAQSCGIHGFIVSWWGQQTNENEVIPPLLKIAHQYGIKICLYYEQIKGEKKNYVYQLNNDLDYIINNYTSHPAYLHYTGKPMLFVYRRPIQQIGVSIWSTYKDFYLVGDKITHPRAKSFSAIHHYNPISYILSCKTMSDIKKTLVKAMANTIRLQNTYGLPRILSVAKGYDDRTERQPGSVVDSRKGKLYKLMWDTALKYKPDIVLITSWNEWHEKTEIEPSLEEGELYLDITRSYPFSNHHIL